MNLNIILEIVKLIAFVLIGGAAIYFKTNADLNSKISDLINQAEEEYKSVSKSGGEKFTFVVDKLYGLVPQIIKPFITRDIIGVLVQRVFNTIEQYAKSQLDKLS